MTAYTPPAGDDVSIGFSQASTSQNGATVIIDFFGEEGGETSRNISPYSITEPLFGTLALENKSKEIYIASIVNATTVFGNASIDLRDKYISSTGQNATEFGDHRVEFFLRYMYPTGNEMGAISAPAISYKNRTIQPDGIFSVFSYQHTIGGSRYVQPAGFAATLFGTRIIPEIQAAYPIGISSPFGWADIRNKTLQARPVGFATGGIEPALQWGWAHVYNTRQYITQDYYGDSGLVPPPWPIWMEISNRNRIVGASGKDASKFGYTVAANNARVLQPLSIAAPTLELNHQITFRIRSVSINSIDPPYFSGWAVAYNNARVIKPTGQIEERFGGQLVLNTRRYYSSISAGDSGGSGTPMVSFRIRTLTFEERYGINPPYIQLPEIKLYTRYIDGIGSDTARYGLPDLAIHWNIITPRWGGAGIFGSTEIKNVTPEIPVFGHNSETFGSASIRTQWRVLAPEGNSTQLHGNTEIAFRTKRIQVNGTNVGEIGDNTRVVGTASPPYTLQYIRLDAEQEYNQLGIRPPTNQVPGPSFRLQFCYPQGDNHSQYGTPSIVGSCIKILAGINDSDVGNASISMKNRVITVGPFNDNLVYNPSPVRITPHTIWAVVEAPPQAIANHNYPLVHYVDGYERPPGAVFGAVTITMQHRSIAALSIEKTASYGQPSITNRTQYINAQGVFGTRFGWMSIPGDRPVLHNYASNTMVFGDATIETRFTDGRQYAAAMGTNHLAFGEETHIDLWNRSVLPNGFDAVAMGISSQYDEPYQWHSLNVGAPMPTIPAGIDTSLFGTQWISNRVRNVEPIGQDSFVSEYTLQTFDLRMRVTRQGSGSGIAPRVLHPVGLDTLAFAVSNVRFGARYIRPDGNSDQYRKGAPS
jgi:hypothetical protein